MASDKATVSGTAPNSDAWNLILSACCDADAPRAVRFLTGAVLAFGGCVLSRSCEPGECATIEFQFARAACVEMYGILLAAGLRLSDASHDRLVSLCQCTRATRNFTGGDLVRIDLAIRALPASKRPRIVPPSAA